MNIFVLHEDPVKAAQAHCDKHVVKMILETAQILSTVWHQALPKGAHYAIPAEAYKPTHRSHPCVRWAGTSSGNYVWLWELGMALCDEFMVRYGHEHKTRAVLYALRLPPPGLRAIVRTSFERCMPDEFLKPGDSTDVIVASYRAYYRTAKAHILNYTNRQRPDWLQ